jgi:hypothetical protein
LDYVHALLDGYPLLVALVMALFQILVSLGIAVALFATV